MPVLVQRRLTMATGTSKKSVSKIQKKQLELRNRLWPDLDEKRLWHRKRNDGFITIPRTMPLVCKILDGLTSGRPASRPYFDLWCRSWDEAFVTISDERERAFYSGLTGQRAVYVWRERMSSLENLGFIDIKPGPRGKFNYVLLWNPHAVIEEAREKGSPNIPDVDYYALTERITEIGG